MCLQIENDYISVRMCTCFMHVTQHCSTVEIWNQTRLLRKNNRGLGQSSALSLPSNPSLASDQIRSPFMDNIHLWKQVWHTSIKANLYKSLDKVMFSEWRHNNLLGKNQGATIRGSKSLMYQEPPGEAADAGLKPYRPPDSTTKSVHEWQPGNIWRIICESK